MPRGRPSAAESVEQATALIREGADAIRDLRPDEIIELLNRLEDLDAQARRQAAACADVEISAPADPLTSPTS